MTGADAGRRPACGLGPGSPSCEVTELEIRGANETIAHTATERTHQVPTYAELNEAIDEIDRIVTKYARCSRRRCW